MKKTISILTPTYNEAENIEKLCLDISNEMKKMNYEYEHIIIDNCSTDNTIPIIKKIAEKDKRVKIIINSKNASIIQTCEIYLGQIFCSILEDYFYKKK